jgi:hypothetical protein
MVHTKEQLNPTTHAFDGSPTPLYQFLPCGNRATFDHGSGMSYRCDQCWAVVGSIGQPQACVDEADKYDNWEQLGGKGWDYYKGCVK